MKSLQEQYSPQGICFGCGRANAQGLKIQSYPSPDSEDVVCRWRPSSHHRAFPGVLNGGIVGALLDCHGVWTTVHALMKKQGLSEAPPVVTASFTVAMKRPTPSDSELLLRARVVRWEAEDRAVVEGELESEGKVRATLQGTFVAVKPGHPAYHRWGDAHAG